MFFGARRKYIEKLEMEAMEARVKLKEVEFEKEKLQETMALEKSKMEREYEE